MLSRDHLEKLLAGDPVELDGCQIALSPELSPTGIASALTEPTLREVILTFVSHPFREALRDEERLLSAAAAMKVAHDNGDPPTKAIAHAIASFALDLVELEVVEQMGLNTEHRQPKT